MFDWHWHDLWTFVRTGFDRFVWYSCTACLSCTLVVWFHYRRYLDPEFDLCHYTIYLWTQVWSNFLLYSAILCELFSKSEKTNCVQSATKLLVLSLTACTLISDTTLLLFLQYVHAYIYIFIIRQIIAMTSEDVNDQNMLQSLA